MSAVEKLRRFVSERLTAAAEEILGVVERTLMEYEQEMEMEMERRRVLLPVPKSEVTPQRMEQRRACREAEVLAEQHVGDQEERIFRLDLKDPEPPRIKEEPEELFDNVAGEHFAPKQEQEQEQEGDHSDPNCEVLTLVLNDGPSDADEDSPNSALATPTECAREPYTCGFCQKSYAYKSQLVIHMRSHTGERPFSCSTCGKGFSRQYLLNVHMRSHTGEKPYCCGTCGKRFSCDGNLNVHMRTHTGEKPFSCCTCGKRFSQKESLRRHMRTHGGDRPPCLSVYRK